MTMNIVKLTNNNFTAETVTNCIGKTTQNNDLSASDIKIEGDANIGCIQTNSLEQIQKCKQMSDALNKTAQQTAQQLGLMTTTDNTSATTTDASASAKSVNVSKGPIEELGNAISGVLDSVFGILGLGLLFSPSGLFLCCILLVIIIIICYSFSGSSKSDTGNLNNLNNLTSANFNDFYSSNNLTSANPNDFFSLDDTYNPMQTNDINN